jgi:transcription antitermination factor NusG
MASRFKHSARLWNKLMHVQMNFKKAKKLAKIKPLERWTIREGDLVELLVGRDRGRQAVVQAVNKERNSVVLEGLKMTKR